MEYVGLNTSLLLLFCLIVYLTLSFTKCLISTIEITVINYVLRPYDQLLFALNMNTLMHNWHLFIFFISYVIYTCSCIIDFGLKFTQNHFFKCNSYYSKNN